MSNIEHVIWGKPPKAEHEEVLYTKATNAEEAKKVMEILAKEHGCSEMRVQVLDLNADPSEMFKKL
jgi:hypothetical protein